MNEKKTPFSISLTDQAADQLKSIMEHEGKSGWVLNYSDVAGHCGGGFGFSLTLAPHPDPQDEILYSQGIQICIPKKSLKRVLGSTIHFEKSSPNDLFDGLLKVGFKIANPNVKAPCSCACEKGYQFYD